MAKPNRTCVICSHQYYYCQGCPDDLRETWHIMFCCDSCKTIYEVLNKYEYKHIDAKQAKELLKDIVDLSNIEKYSEGTQKLLKEVFSSDNISEENESTEQVKRPTPVKHNKSKNRRK